MKKILLTLCCFLFPANAFGYGCDCGSVQTIVTAGALQTVQSVNMNTTMEAEATRANTTKEAELIRSEILEAAQNIIGTIQVESATIVRAILALKESNVAVIKGQSAAHEATKTEDIYGKAAQPAGLCGATSLGAGIQLGAQASQDVQATMREKQIEYGSAEDKKPLDYLHRIIMEDHPEEADIVDAFFPVQTTLTEEQVAIAHEAIKTIANPQPSPVLSDEQKDTPAGQIYTAARKVHQGRLSSVMDTLNAHVVYHSPTLSNDVTSWAQNQWAEAGGSGTPPGLVDGKLSEAGLYKLLSQMRVGNPNWFTQIASATEAGLLRELVLMQAFQFELLRKNTDFLDRIAFMTSLDALTRLDKEYAKELNDLYVRTIGTQQ